MKTRILLVLSLLFFFGFQISAQIIPPANLQALQVNHGEHASVLLSWTPSGTTGINYNVFKKESNSFGHHGGFRRLFSRSKDTTFVDRNVYIGDTCYYFVVASLDSLKSESDTVNIVIAQPPSIKGMISGVITADSTGLPLSWTRILLIGGGHNFEQENTVTDSLGNYSIVADSGHYYLGFNKRGYVSEFFDNVNSIQLASPVNLKPGDSLTINASLAKYYEPPTYTFSGKVTDTLGNPLRANVKLFKLRTNTFHWSTMTTRTDQSGNFTFTVKGGDTVIVYAEPANKRDFLAEYYSDKHSFDEADRIGISANVTGINFLLKHKPVLPNGISGTIQDTLGVGVASHIAVFRVVNNHVDKKYVTLSDSLGNYALGNILPGKYILKAVPTNNYRATYFKYDGTQTLNWRNADSVMVDSLNVVNNINFVVRSLSDTGLGVIAGVIKNNNNQLSPGVFVYAMDSRNQIFTFAVTDKNGKFVMDGITPGKYNIVTDMVDYQSSVQNLTVDYNNSISHTLAISISPSGVTDVAASENIPTGYNLLQNYPNPFNPSTVISFEVVKNGLVSLKVFDVLGNEVRTLVNEVKSPGKYNVNFNASHLSSGVYYYQIKAGEFTATKKLVLMK